MSFVTPQIELNAYLIKLVYYVQKGIVVIVALLAVAL